MNDTTARTGLVLDQFIGESEWTQRVRRRVLQVANHKYGVLITGPSGTGKELIARAVHACSDRFERPFIPVNCAAIPAGLFSSQLFGHVKGAFTGAQYASLGCFRAADRGTIFLDEIGELDLDCQAKLLRVLQEKVVNPVGGTEELAVDVRTVAATNRNLVDEVRAGRFRLDLYYRLNVISLETRGLAQRRDDIVPLATHFLAKTAIECGAGLKELSPEAIRLLESYDWPGNVRELENFIERAVVFSENETIGPEAFACIETAGLSAAVAFPRALPEFFDENLLPVDAVHETTMPVEEEGELQDGDQSLEDWPTLAVVEQQHIRRTLRETFYNQSAAARLLGIDRKSLARKVKKYGIEVPRAGLNRRPPR